MPIYRYKAVNPAGEIFGGDFEASSEQGVVYHLRDRGLLPVRIELATGSSLPGSQVASAWWSRRGMNADQILAFTRELATLLRAGLALDRALELLVNLAATPQVAAILQTIRDDVRSGQSFSQALEARGNLFSRFYLSLVRAGEAGGALTVAMQRLADALERSKELKSSVVSALIYPAILIFVAAASVLLLLIKVVPQFTELFKSAGKVLPWHTELIFSSAEFVQSWWWAFLIVSFLLVRWWQGQMRRPVSRLRWDLRFLRWGRIGDLIIRVEMARFARTLGTLLGNGVSLLSALSIVKEAMTNTALAGALDGVSGKLREGKGLGKPLADTGLYPKLAVNMILVGEESGQLETMLLRVADIYDREVQVAVKRLLAMLEPALILFLAVVIGGMVLSILTTMMDIYDFAGK